MEKKTLNVGKATSKEAKCKHTPSTMQADTLFTFTSRLEYLICSIQNQMLSPRYCEEDIRYLKISGIKRLAFPMKCFCDINLHRLNAHLEWYGYYGIAFSKEWGMRNGIQPIQYINPSSRLREDFAEAFNAAIQADIHKEIRTQAKLKNLMLHELMYFKPYEGKMKNRISGKIEKKCFTDECEWRYVPDVSCEGYEEVYYDETILDDHGLLNDFSNAIAGIQSVALSFEYSDIKYIIVKSIPDFNELVSKIKQLEVADEEKDYIISKIVVWDESRGGFLVFVDFNRVFKNRPQTEISVPASFASYLNSSLPKGFKYVVSADGTYTAVCEEQKYTISGFELNPTSEQKRL